MPYGALPYVRFCPPYHLQPFHTQRTCSSLIKTAAAPSLMRVVFASFLFQNIRNNNTKSRVYLPLVNDLTLTA